MGRITTYTDKVAHQICDRIAEGEPLRAICRDMGIAWRTIYHWRSDNEEFAARIAIARAQGMEAILEDILDIADQPELGLEVTESEDGKKSTKKSDMLGHRKLRIDTRLKLLAKWDPSKYGDKVENTHKGDPAAPLTLILNGSDIHG